jgi:hypothetical protein
MILVITTISGVYMSLIPTIKANALQILQQTQSQGVLLQGRSPTDLSGASTQGISSQTEILDPAKSKLAASIFSVTNVDINELKLNLMNRAGKALGLDENNYPSTDEYFEAVGHVVQTLKTHGSEGVIKSIEKEIGLDKLGVSLEDLFSKDDPEASDRVTKALEKTGGNHDEEMRSAEGSLVRIAIDASGIYTISTS